MRVLLALLLFLSTPLLAGPSPTPVKPNALKLTQGTVTRMLPVNPPCLKCTYTEVTQSGQRRFGGGSLGGGWVQFPTSGGPVATQWITPTATCPAVPPDAAQDATCPNGQGTFHQTHGWAQSAPPACTLTALPWNPATPPAGTCEGTPPFAWQAPLPPSQLVMPAKPAKGGSFTSVYGTNSTRITDHANDPVSPAHPPWLRVQYSRLQSFNADDSLLLIYQPDGGYNVFNASAPYAFVKKLNGVGGDPEFQFDPVNPNVGRYLGNNGSTILRKLDIAANTSVVDWDFTAQAHAVAPDADRWSTKAEGSPSADGCIWALMGRHEQSGTWPTRGYMALNICTRTVVWSKTSSGEFDSISATPSGRWAVGNGTGSTPTVAFKLDGTTQFSPINHGEHSDLGALPNGHDFFATCDYSAAGDGWCFSVDLDTGVRTNLLRLYNNPYVGDNYAVHISAKAFNRPGWVVIGTYGGSTAASNLFLVDVVHARVYGLGALFARVGDYWDEPHAFADRDLKRVCYNENFRQSLTGDAYCIDVPALPN